MDFILKSLQLAIANLSHLTVVTFTLSTLSLELQLLNLLFVLLNLIDKFLLTLPLRLILAHLLLKVGNLLVELREFILIILTLDSLTLYFELCQTTSLFVQFLWKRVALHTKLCGRLVHKVDSLVRQESVGDITLRELNGRYAGIILNTYTMMILITLLQATED